MSTDSDSESEIASPPPELLMSSLVIHVNSQSQSAIDTIILDTCNAKREIRQVISPGGSHKERFDPPLEISLYTKILVSIRCGGVRDVVSISLDPNTIVSEAIREDGKQVYHKTEGDIKVIIGIQSLLSTVSEIVESCPRFRVLVIGKSGVGKSTLICRVFGASCEDVSDTTNDEAAIDQEHTAPDNDYFIVHESCAFEDDDHRSWDDIHSFIFSRQSMADIKDRLHAIWLCLEIPFAGGRVLDAGVEEFIRDNGQIFRNIPLVIVFTKLDFLVNALHIQAADADQSLDDRGLEEEKRKALEIFCFGPVRKAMGNRDVPSVVVSAKEVYEDGLSELVDKTTTCIQKYNENEAVHYIATIAQRVNITLKVEATIALGEKRYWNMLKESPNFRGHTMRACLDVLHKDIVSVWNFKDPRNNLYGEDFKEALLKTPKGVEHSFRWSMTVIAALTIIGSAGAGDLILVPLDGTLRLKLAHDRYKVSEDIVKQLMAYIIDLSCVVQILWHFVTVWDSKASTELARFSMQAYEQTYRCNVHSEINKFVTNFQTLPRKQDDVLDKIKELVSKYRIPDGDIQRIRLELRATGVQPEAKSPGGGCRIL